MLYPAERKSISDRLGRNIDDGDGNGPSRKAVHDGEEVAEAVRGSERNEIHVEVRKALRWDLKIPDWWDGVSCHLRLLASDAFASPAVCVGPD